MNYITYIIIDCYHYYKKKYIFVGYKFLKTAVNIQLFF